MSSPLSILAVLLVIGLFSGFVAAVFQGGSKFVQFQEWSSLDGRPITGTDTSGLPSDHSIENSDWPVHPQLLPSFAASMAEGVEPTPKKHPSASRQLTNRTCKICSKVCKNSTGVAIHVGKAHRDLHSCAVSSTE